VTAVDPAGEHICAHAAATPDRPALVMVPSGATRTYREIDEASLRCARMLRDRGLGVGDHVAVLLDNQPEFYDVVWGAQRLGCYVTPINWHLTADEAGYIVADCDATALVATARLAGVVGGMGDALAAVTTRIAVDGDLPGFERYDDLVAGLDAGDLPGQREGGWMFYSSGTTGRPKGILPPLAEGDLGAPSFLTRLLTGLFGFTADTVYLSPAPLYHAAPAGWTTGTQRLGGTAVVMERFDPLELLAAIERHRVTHVQLVPTHMIRLLKLSAEERARHDLSSLRMVVHAAAPCPVEVKRATLDWLGPIVHEFYSGSEGAGFCHIGPEDWLAHPGSVGRSTTGAIHIVGEGGEELPVGEEGVVWFETTRRFEYHRDPDKTKAAWDPRGWSWLGDVGRVDADGYLYLTDRASHMIISGGVNIYPREVEDVLVVHPAVADVAVVGTPDPDMGEQVTAFVQRAEGATVDEAELIAWCRDRLSHFKCPRSVRFVAELPRLPTGKLLKRLLVTAPGA
jgi:long-chain acyl-CoA synthetase